MLIKESFSDELRRLFPEEHKNCKMCVRGNFTRDITIQVTESCNLCCSYCYEHAKSPKSMSWETAKKFIDMILASDAYTAPYMQSKECPGVMLNFIGGEPLLEIELIHKICDYFIEQCILLDHPWANRYRFSICTNGILYFDDRVQQFLREHKNHISLTVTIDGNKEMHDMCRVDKEGKGSYDKAIAAAKHWKKISGQEQEVKITIAPANIKVCGNAILEFIKQGIKQINVNCVFEKGWTKEHANILYQQLIQISDYLLDNDLQDDFYITILDQPSGDKYDSPLPWCGGNGLMLCVDPRGDLYPCVRYTPCSVGDGPKYKLGDIWNGFTEFDKINALSTITRTSQVKGTKCETCPISQGCADCAGYSYEIYGDVGKRTDFICDMHIARTLAQIYYRNKSYQKTGKKTPLRMNVPIEWTENIISKEEYLYLEGIANNDQLLRLQQLKEPDKG